jgi:hypothetical protein
VLATTPPRLEMVRRLGEPGVAEDHAAYRQRCKVGTITRR